METATIKLIEASQKMDLLKRNVDNYGTRQQLELATAIRDSVLNDSSVVQGCDRDVTLTERRKEILEEIKNFQLALISRIQTTINNDGNVNYNEKFDYSVAKKDLILLAEKELKENVQWAKLAPDEFSLVRGIEKHIESLHDVVESCKNDKYTILLMGEYQSGKTTTLNAICEGRHIGAIGKGNKTSAVPLSITYSQNESIIIRWKSKKDFIDIFSHLSAYIPEFIFQEFDIENSELRKQLSNKIDELRVFFEKINQKDRQFVAVCSLVLHYWNSDDLNRVKGSNSNITLSDIGTMSKFPKDFITRWKENGASGFEFNESVFAFIEKIDCYCNSSILKNMNCSIMDCPGLFANEYDTQVTLKEINKADAILYILPREKQTGENNDESLDKLIREYGDWARKKLVIANNISLIEPNTETIYRTNKDYINITYNNQFDLELFDARAAYLSQIKHSYDENRLDEITILDFISSVPPKPFSFRDILNGAKEKRTFENFEDAWSQAVSLYNNINENGLDELLAKLIDFVKRNKAYSIIVSKGVDRLFEELKQFQIDLQSAKIKPYTDGRKKTENDWTDRIKNLQGFGKLANNIVHQTLFDTKDCVSQRLSDAIYAKLFPDSVYDSMIDKICDHLFSAAATLKKMEKDEKKLKEHAGKIVTECITDVVHGRVSYWNNLMASNQDLDMKNIFEPAVNSMEITILAKWKEKFKDDELFKQNMNNYYPISKNAVTFSINSNKQTANVNVKQGDISSVVSLNRAAIAVGIAGGLVYGAGWFLALSGPIGWLICGVVALGAGIFGRSSIEEYNSKNFKKKLKPELEKQINESGVKGSIKNMICKEVNRLMSSFESNLRVNMELANRNRDIAISALDDPELESNCFKAIGAIERLEGQKKCYIHFKFNL